MDAPSSPNEVIGTVGGRSFDARDSIARDIPSTNGFSFVGPATFVQLSDFATACTLSMQHQGPTGSRILLLAVGAIDASGKSTAPGPGTFTVHGSSQSLPVSSKSAQVYYGSGCGKDVAYEGVSGSIVVTSSAAGVVVGTFDVTISCATFSSCAGPDEHLTGKFTTAACAALDVSSTPSCI